MNSEGSATHHVENEELQFYILGRLSADEVDVLERHVFQCPQCKDKLDMTAQIVAQLLKTQRDDRGPERRREPRLLTSDIAEALDLAPQVVRLRCFAPLLPERWPVEIIDVSKNGLGLLVPVQLPPGALVQVQVGKTFVLGEVTHSKKISDQEFRAGIGLQDVWWWRK